MTKANIVGKFTKVPNELLDNTGISVNARYLMAFILRLDKKTWDFSLSGLAKATGMTVRSVTCAFEELVNEGYCIKGWYSAGQGKCGWFYVFSISRFSTIEKTTSETSTVEDSTKESSSDETSTVELSNIDFFYFRKNGDNIRLYNIYKDFNNPILNKIKDSILAQNAKTHTPEKKTLEERTQVFYNALIPYVEKYDKEMIRAFYDYWSEPNRSKTKMRCETQPTFDISRRLATWHKNDEKRKFSGSRKNLPIGMIPGEESVGKFTGMKSEDVFKD